MGLCNKTWYSPGLMPEQVLYHQCVLPAAHDPTKGPCVCRCTPVAKFRITSEIDLKVLFSPQVA